MEIWILRIITFRVVFFSPTISLGMDRQNQFLWFLLNYSGVAHFYF